MLATSSQERSHHPRPNDTADVLFFASVVVCTMVYCLQVMEEERTVLTIQNWEHLPQTKKEAKLPAIIQRWSSSKYHEAALLGAFLYGVAEGDASGNLKDTIRQTIPDSDRWIESMSTRLKARANGKWLPESIGLLELWYGFYGSGNISYLKQSCDQANRWPDPLLKDYVYFWHTKYFAEHLNPAALCYLPGHVFRKRNETALFDYLSKSEYWTGQQVPIEVMMAQVEEDEQLEQMLRTEITSDTKVKGGTGELQSYIYPQGHSHGNASQCVCAPRDTSFVHHGDSRLHDPETDEDVPAETVMKLRPWVLSGYLINAMILCCIPLYILLSVYDDELDQVNNKRRKKNANKRSNKKRPHEGEINDETTCESDETDLVPTVNNEGCIVAASGEELEEQEAKLSADIDSDIKPTTVHRRLIFKTPPGPFKTPPEGHGGETFYR